MRAGFMLLVIVLQLVVLGFMAGEREWILHRGQVIYLRTAPLDPVDPFRGSYVRLDYDIGHIPTNLVRGGWLGKTTDRLTQEKRVYVSLKQAEGGVATVDYLSEEKPAEGLFLRGKLDRYWRPSSVLTVRYGLEAFFAQPDKAKQMEALRRRGEIQVPLEMEVAVSPKGISVMKGFRWCELGVGTQIEMAAPPTNREIRAVTITLMNVSSNALAVVDRRDGGSLSLENDEARSWRNDEGKWVGPRQSPLPLTDADVILLKPGESHAMKVDLTKPEWFVSIPGGETQAIARLQSFGVMFRLIYQAPSAEECRSLEKASFIWHGKLVSSAFGRGRVD